MSCGKRILAWSAVQHDAALAKVAMPMPERAPRPSRDGDLLRIEASAFKRGKGRADRERELRAGAEPACGGIASLDAEDRRPWAMPQLSAMLCR